MKVSGSTNRTPEYEDGQPVALIGAIPVLSMSESRPTREVTNFRRLWMGDLLYFRDYQSAKAKAQYESIFPSLEQQAVEIMNVALLGNPHETAMAEYYRDCAKTGSSASMDKAREGMPGVVRTADGDLIKFGSEFYESSLGFVAPPDDCA